MSPSPLTTVLVALIIVIQWTGAQQAGTPTQTRPDFDLNQLRSYLLNEKFFGILTRCLFQGAGCDVIGRWVKPRLPHAIFGTACETCGSGSAKELELIREFLLLLQSKFPNIMEIARTEIEKLIQAHNENGGGAYIHRSINSTGRGIGTTSNEDGNVLVRRDNEEQVKKALHEFNFTHADADPKHSSVSINIPILP